MTEQRDIASKGPIEHERQPTKALVFVPVFRRHDRSGQGHEADPRHERSDEAKLAEAMGLARAIGLSVVGEGIVSGQKPRPATLIGAGKVEDIKALAATEEAGLVIFDHPLTPIQQRNLERELDLKVLDRTGLILEIFGERAQTKEGRLQVELAHLNYQRGRLVRSWTHLERQRGGAGFMGGPGETQIEADRRQLQGRIKRLEGDLAEVRRTRGLHRAKRKRSPQTSIALVGYTNAGKSTLFNRLTGADVMVQDLLFATLDPTMRRTTLAHGTEVLFSDTVGFVSDLPTHLVAAFRATLEEVTEADIVLHVRDIADPDTLAQADDVRSILRQLGIDTEDADRVVEVWNKIDSLDTEARTRLATASESQSSAGSAHLVSAVTGEGIDALLAELERRAAGRLVALTLTFAPDNLSALSWIYDNARVFERADNDDGSVTIVAEVTGDGRAALQAMGVVAREPGERAETV